MESKAHSNFMQGKRAQNSLGFLNTRESLSMQNLKEIKEKKSRDKLWWPQKFQPIVELKNIITDLKFSSIVLYHCWQKKNRGLECLEVWRGLLLFDPFQLFEVKPWKSCRDLNLSQD